VNSCELTSRGTTLILPGLQRMSLDEVHHTGTLTAVCETRCVLLSP